MAKSSLKKEDLDREEATERLFKSQSKKKSLTDIISPRETPVVESSDDNVSADRSGTYAEKSMDLNKTFYKMPDYSQVAQVPVRPAVNPALGLPDPGEKDESGPRKILGKIIVAAVILIIMGVGFYAAFFYLPSAEIHVVLKKTQWEYPDLGDPNGPRKVLASVASGGDIPAQLLTENKNLQLSFPASGKKKNVSVKAGGTITVYNAYNLQTQNLVATTRFLTPDGKLFRLDKSITVPAAKMKDGKIEPQGIDAAITADQPGAEYNIGPVDRWTVPGFTGPRHEGFYGVSAQPMTGGFVGETAYPTDEDIAKAKDASNRAVKDAIEAAFALKPDDLTILDSGDNFSVTKEMVLGQVDESGQFKYFIEAKNWRLAIRESDLVSFFVKKAQSKLEVPDAKLYKDLVHGPITVDKVITKSEGSIDGVTLRVDLRGDFVRSVDLDDLKAKILGKSKDSLQTIVLGMPGVDSAKVLLWPLWVRSVPNNSAKVTIIAE